MLNGRHTENRYAGNAVIAMPFLMPKPRTVHILKALTASILIAIQAQSPQAWERLYQVTVDSNPGFRKGSGFVEKYAKVPFLQVEHDLQALGRAPEVIRDDNMLVEYKYGKK